MMVVLTEAELNMILEVAERVAKRTGSKVAVRWDRVVVA
jgi:hypothetical protein